MERIVIPEIEIGGVHIEKLNLFVDDDGNLIILPFLWALHLANTGSVFTWIKKGSYSKFHTKKTTASEQILENNSVFDNTIRNYLGHIFKLLLFIDDLNSNSLSVHQTELLSSPFLNNYLNNELPKNLKSVSSLNAHHAAINAYLAFLFELEITDIIRITIYRKTKQYMAEADTRLKKINYVSKSERSQILRVCNSHRDRLIIRLGYEVGLRTSELCGLLLRKKNEQVTPSRIGLINLFFELDQKPSKNSFVYLIDGKFTKRGKSRNIYFDRELLQAMKDYYNCERLIIEKQSKHNTDTLLLRADPVGYGLPIGINQGTNTFRELRTLFPNMNMSLSYHDLRHTFATEIYHNELMDSEGQETRSESAALIAVSERLGHADSRTTSKYIRLRQQMLIIEDEHYG